MPTELFSRLDDWSYPYLTIPHGNSWGPAFPGAIIAAQKVVKRSSIHGYSLPQCL